MKKLIALILLLFFTVTFATVKANENETITTSQDNIIEVEDEIQEDKPSDMCQQFIDEWIPRIMTYVFSLGGVITAIVVFLKKGKDFIQLLNGVRKATEEDKEKLKGELNTALEELKLSKESYIQASEKLDNSLVTQEELKRMIDGLKFIIKNDPNLIKIGIAEEAIKKLDGEVKEG